MTQYENLLKLRAKVNKSLDELDAMTDELQKNAEEFHQTITELMERFNITEY